MKIWPALLVLPLLPASVPAECLTVAGPTVRASDLAAAVPGLAALSENPPLFSAPRPGVRRFLQPAELRRIARSIGLDLDHHAVLCIERRTQPLSPQILQSAAVHAWVKAGGAADAAVTLLDYSRMPVPQGELEFVWPPPQTFDDCRGGKPVILRGRLSLGEGQSVPVWASVRVDANQHILVYQKDLPPGSVLASEDIAFEAIPCPRAPPGLLLHAHAATGQRLRAAAKKGQPVRAAQLAPVREVNSGDHVAVRIAGLDRVLIQARAVTSGRRGEIVILENPLNKSRFKAQIEGPQQAFIAQETPDDIRRHNP